VRPLPWKTSLEPDPEATYLAMASSLPLRRFAATPRFFTHVQAIRRQLSAATGLVGYALWAKPLSKRYWTLSVWTDEEALARFMRTSPHVDVMRRLRPGMSRTRFVQWPVEGSNVPITWSEALRRLEAAAGQEDKTDAAG
jgi:quinol monooxygenase YgiN